MTLKVNMQFVRETKNQVLYKSDSHEIQNIYIAKAALGASPYPKTITVTVNAS